MKELHFSIQCGASNRKALVARRCSQCKVTNDDIELNEIPQENQLISHSHRRRSSSVISANLQPPKHRSNLERTSDLDKFDTLLMLAADRTNYLDARRKHRRFSASSQRKDIPLVLVEQQQPSNYEPNVRSHQVRFSTNAGRVERFNGKQRERKIYF
jgi:hypothetical protein